MAGLGFFRLVFCMKRPLGFQHIYSTWLTFFLCQGAKICQGWSTNCSSSDWVWPLTQWRETNYVERKQLWAKLEVLIFIPTLPRAPTQNLPLSSACRPASGGIASSKADGEFKQGTGATLWARLPLTCLVWLERIFGWAEWISLCYEEQKVESLFLCRWHDFIVMMHEWAHYCQEKLAQNELF